MGQPNSARVPHKHAALIKANLHRFVYNDGCIYWADNYGPRARKGNRVGTPDSSGYLQVKIGGSSVLVHRIVWMLFNDTYPEQLDHINRVRTDNHIHNLRAATNTTNQHNASMRKDNTSGCVGVHNKNGKWQVRIQLNGKRIHLGTFDNKDVATKVYATAKEKYHGQAA